MFVDSREYLHAELHRLDVLLHRQILRLRATYQLSLDEFRGLYVSDQQVDSLVAKFASENDAVQSVEELTRKAHDLHLVNLESLNNDSAWMRIIKEFNLACFEQDVLLLAIAPAIDLKYETLYAYLNNDVTRKLPTFDLALRLFAENAEEQRDFRNYLFPSASLFRTGLLRINSTAPERPSWLATNFYLTPFVSQYLLGLESGSSSNCITPTTTWDEVPVASSLRSDLGRIPRVFNASVNDEAKPILVFEGHYGSGRRLAAEATCRSLGLSLMDFDLVVARSGPEQLQHHLETVTLQQQMRRAGLYLRHAEALFDKEGNPIPEALAVLARLTTGSLPVFLECTPGTAWRELLKERRSLSFQFGDLSYGERFDWWNSYASQSGYTLSPFMTEMLASRFVLTAGQIKNAVASARDASKLRDEGKQTLTLAELLQAARDQSDQSLGSLSLRVNTIYGWDDLVLPQVTLKQVQEIAAAIKNRHVVYSQWGFERRIAYGKGLKVLFAGPSGTGKTMTAGVIARDLGFDLFKIDLSSVVSKYIGETEKNLDRIFRAAHLSNAILFFDEADALFGKRSEVKDAHDRYANIEVAYLLQKVEEHEGAVILASNLSKNIDNAFSRRMHYVVEFPLPGEPHREQLWRGMFPPEAPLGSDVDFRFLAKQFQISGGDIKNVVLAAAFLAAQDGQVVTMEQVIKAVARQMSKQGRIPSTTDFKQYHALIEQA